MAVPDSRSMLWIEPYEWPVDATSERMLAPRSCLLRSSMTNWSLVLLSFFIALPAVDPCRIPRAETVDTAEAEFAKKEHARMPQRQGAQANSMRSR